MVSGSRYGVVAGKAVRRILLVGVLAVVCGLQGCATSLETFGLGAGLGAIGAVGGLICAVGCH